MSRRAFDILDRVRDDGFRTVKNPGQLIEIETLSWGPKTHGQVKPSRLNRCAKSIIIPEYLILLRTLNPIRNLLEAQSPQNEAEPCQRNLTTPRGHCPVSGLEIIVATLLHTLFHRPSLSDLHGFPRNIAKCVRQ